MGNPSAPSYEASVYFMGRRYRPGGGIVVQHVAKRMHEDSQIQKEKRKLAESKGVGKSKSKPNSPPNPEGGGGPKK